MTESETLQPAGLKQRIGWIDAAKGTSIILVAFYHVSQFGKALGFHVDAMQGVSELLTPIRMPLFFAAAGLTAGSVLSESWRSLWNRRLSLYAWVFTLWAGLSSLFFAAVPHPRHPTVFPTIGSFFENLIVPENELWFLWCLGLFYLIAWVGVRHPRLVLIAALGAAGLGFVLGETTQMSSEALPLPITNSLKYFVFFIGAAQFRSTATALVTGRYGPTGCLIVAYTVLTFASHYLDGNGFGGLVKMTAAFVGVFAVCNTLAIILRAVPSIGSLLSWVGERTLPIYLLQAPLITALYYALMAALPISGGMLTLLPITVFAVCAPLALGFSKLHAQGHRCCTRRRTGLAYQYARVQPRSATPTRLNWV